MFSFKGRLNRKAFLIQSIIVGVIQILNVVVISYVQKTLHPSSDIGTSLLSIPVSLTSMVISIGVIIFSLSIIARRWHDLGKSGWMALLGIIPIVNFVVWLYLVFKEGAVGSNKYGAAQK